VDTVIDGVKFSEGLEKIGQIMDRGTICNTYTAGDLGFILHSRHQFHWHTGYAPPITVAAPHIGAWVAKDARPHQPRPARVHRHRPDLQRGRGGGTKGLPHRRLPRAVSTAPS
jgi:hypothetical protein